MKRLTVLVLIFCMASAAKGEVSTRVCRADGNTPVHPPDPNFPHIYPPIMVGTKLTIIVYPEFAENWAGSLVIADANMDYGFLSARDFNESTLDWEGSRFKAAGDGAVVWDWEETGIDGFDLYTGFRDIEIGDWFIIDYTATSTGDCRVEFYESFVHDPNRDLFFTHVCTRDFNKDTNVDFADLAVFTSYWQVSNCNDLEWCGCEGTDLDSDSDVDLIDLGMFVDYWLERTE